MSDVVMWGPPVWRPWLGAYERYGFGTGTTGSIVVSCINLPLPSVHGVGE